MSNTHEVVLEQTNPDLAGRYRSPYAAPTPAGIDALPPKSPFHRHRASAHHSPSPYTRSPVVRPPYARRGSTEGYDVKETHNVRLFRTLQLEGMSSDLWVRSRTASITLTGGRLHHRVITTMQRRHSAATSPTSSAASPHPLPCQHTLRFMANDGRWTRRERRKSSPDDFHPSSRRGRRVPYQPHRPLLDLLPSSACPRPIPSASSASAPYGTPLPPCRPTRAKPFSPAFAIPSL